jgi:hypothetical protein
MWRVMALLKATDVHITCHETGLYFGIISTHCTSNVQKGNVIRSYTASLYKKCALGFLSMDGPGYDQVEYEYIDPTYASLIRLLLWLSEVK